VLREYVDDVFTGTAVGMRLVGAQRGVIGIKEKYSDVITLLRSKLPRNMDVAPLRDAYPAGDEFILVYDVLGRVIPPGGIPLAVGAVVMNVETAMNVATPPIIRSPKNISPSPGPWPSRHLARAGRCYVGPMRGGRRRTHYPRRQLHRRRRDDGLPRREP